MNKEDYEIPAPGSPAAAEVTPDLPAPPARQSGWDRMMEILRMPKSWRRGLYKEFFGLWSSMFMAGGLIVAIVGAVLLFLFFAGDEDPARSNSERPPGSGAGNSSGGGRNDSVSDDDRLEDYVPPE